MSSGITPGDGTIYFENIPPELKAFPHWVLWNLEPNKDGRMTKVPYKCNGDPAKNNDPSTWADFQSVVASYELGGSSGIGFVFQKSCGIIGIDLDHVVDPATGKIIVPWALKVVQDLKSYTEYSPSGDGLHIFCKGSIPANGKDGVESHLPHIEMYCDRLYFTVTGRVFHA